MLNVILGSSNPYFFSLDIVVVAGHIHIITLNIKIKRIAPLTFLYTSFTSKILLSVRFYTSLTEYLFAR